MNLVRAHSLKARGCETETSVGAALDTGLAVRVSDIQCNMSLVLPFALHVNSSISPVVTSTTNQNSKLRRLSMVGHKRK